VTVITFTTNQAHHTHLLNSPPNTNRRDLNSPHTTYSVKAGNMNREDLFKFLAGIGLRAVAIETYERLHRIPILETMFRRELGYRINQYNTTREEVGRLNSTINKLDELERESTSAIA
jgi:hypothetical protein